MKSFQKDILDFSGQVVAHGRLLLLRLIGSGSYGRVYRAVDTVSNPEKPQHYAVKCLSKTHLTAAQLLRQRRELRLHQCVSGLPHVLSLHAIIEEECYRYLVLDLSSSDLFCAIKDGVFFYNDVRIRQAFVEILDGVHGCHERGIYHRDLKPENILCKRDGTGILIADFGLATRKRLCSDFGCGSKPYMGPECLGRTSSSSPYSPLHTDLWALGIILVNMVTGDTPWYSAIPSDDRFWSFVHNPNFLRDVLPISQPLNELLKRVFNYDPAARISIPEMREEILNMETLYMSREELRSTSAQEWMKELDCLVTSYDRDLDLDAHDNDAYSGWTYDVGQRIRGSTEVPARCCDIDSADAEPDCLWNCSNGCSLGSDPESEGPFTPETHVGELLPKIRGPSRKGILNQALATLTLGTSFGTSLGKAKHAAA
ncbi:serine/threonine protein kinase, negative regulator of sexual conjugation and meiosis [Phlebopus sp. FC_14]|nr:serine/threonine protein kinase, negative regulator of sexual conjugation and meiosis [Phlebopus sp. FC_14]